MDPTISCRLFGTAELGIVAASWSGIVAAGRPGSNGQFRIALGPAYCSACATRLCGRTNRPDAARALMNLPRVGDEPGGLSRSARDGVLWVIASLGGSASNSARSFRRRSPRSQAITGECALKNRLAPALSFIVMGAVAAPAAAQDRHPCLNDACTIVSIVGQAPAAGSADEAAATRYGRWGFDIAGMNRAVKPGDDWFEYVNGTWRRTRRFGRRSSYGASPCFAICPRRGCASCSKATAPTPRHVDRAKVAALYGGFMVSRRSSAPMGPHGRAACPITAAATRRTWRG